MGTLNQTTKTTGERKAGPQSNYENYPYLGVLTSIKLRKLPYVRGTSSIKLRKLPRDFDDFLNQTTKTTLEEYDCLNQTMKTTLEEYDCLNQTTKTTRCRQTRPQSNYENYLHPDGGTSIKLRKLPTDDDHSLNQTTKTTTTSVHLTSIKLRKLPFSK